LRLLPPSHPLLSHYCSLPPSFLTSRISPAPPVRRPSSRSSPSLSASPPTAAFFAISSPCPPSLRPHAPPFGSILPHPRPPLSLPAFFAPHRRLLRLFSRFPHHPRPIPAPPSPAARPFLPTPAILCRTLYLPHSTVTAAPSPPGPLSALSARFPRFFCFSTPAAAAAAAASSTSQHLSPPSSSPAQSPYPPLLRPDGPPCCSRNHIGDDGARALAGSLQGLAALKLLYL
jgi:hypothetical protein